MIRTFPTELNGLRVGYNAGSLVVDYAYPGTIDIHIANGITLKTTGKDAKNVPLGRLRVERTAEGVMDDHPWEWDPSCAARARAWVQHVLVTDSLGKSQSYEFEGQVVLVGHHLPPRAAEVSLYAAGFRPSLGTWRAPATDERRARLPEFVRALGGDGAAIAATRLTVPSGELKERGQHMWMRWHAIFRTTLEVGGRTYHALGLVAVQAGRRDEPAFAHCIARLDRPEPQLALGQALVGVASACIDVSDGLVADLGHVAAASGVGLRIELDAIPHPPFELGAALGLKARAVTDLALGGGDDYLLAFTVDAARLAELRERVAALGLPLHEIGGVVPGAGVSVITREGGDYAPARAGFNHFGNDDGE